MNPLQRVVTVAAAAGLFLVAASSSLAGQRPDGQRQEEAHQMAMAPVGHGDVMIKHEVALANEAPIDDRIEVLLADMHMFTGELKMYAMDQLLTAIVERQSAIRAEMRLMHGAKMPEMMSEMTSRMTSEMMGRSAPDAPPAWSDDARGSWLDWLGDEPAGACAPKF